MANQQTVIILGRQPAIGLAELESLFGADKLRPVGEQAVLLEIEPAEIDFSRLGGTVKFCKLLTVLDTTDWSKIQHFLVKSVPEHARMLPDGKLTIGLSTYGLPVTVPRLNATGLTIKKVLKKDRPVRIVPNVETSLNSAQVLHNKLTHQLGWELVFVRDGQKTIVAQNIAEQDIEAYAARDQARPKRDSRVGMLPPKLAQTIINLSVGTALPKTVLDPFCGTGVILQEALLMGYAAYGSDLELKMVDYTKENLDWLVEQKIYSCDPTETTKKWTVQVADATNHEWSEPFDLIASETYLGRPFSVLPAPDVLRQVINDVNTIHRKFLQNLAKQTKPGFRLCLAVPAWKTGQGFKQLPILDHLTDMGYTRWSFVHANNEDLIYHREGQIVARELVVLTRK